MWWDAPGWAHCPTRWPLSHVSLNVIGRDAVSRGAGKMGCFFSPRSALGADSLRLSDRRPGSEVVADLVAVVRQDILPGQAVGGVDEQRRAHVDQIGRAHV